MLSLAFIASALKGMSSMNKLRNFPKSKIERSNFKTCKIRKRFISTIGHIYVNHLKTNPTLFTNVSMQR